MTGWTFDRRARGSRIAIAIMAAGTSQRLGFPKQLVSFRGQPLIRAVTTAACEAARDGVAVVLGAYAPDIAACLSSLDVDVVINGDWQAGLSTSIRCATSWAIARDASALLIAMGDQPYLDGAHLQRLMAAHDLGGHPVASAYAGARGVPAIFPRALFPRLLDLTGDRGAGRILRASRDTVGIDWPEGAFDVDVATDVARLAAT
jgi:molybdenum cofactor cytidylyltransferase